MKCTCGVEFPEIGLARVQSSIVQQPNDPDYIALVRCHCGKFFALVQEDAAHEAGATFTGIPASWNELKMPHVEMKH